LSRCRCANPGVNTPGYGLAPRRGFLHDWLEGGGRGNILLSADILIGGATDHDFSKHVDELAAQG